ncbi:uncharacterized protein LOC134816842 [Bolinopsis microptera]|uniref:uncharacterized protein LOC134816842 n=1 Tax=Bolinopsis microptera TaxID=2820187 RepID=UPI003078F6C6
MGHEPNKPEIEPNTLERLTKLVEFTKKKDLPLVMGADSNGHHILWNSFRKNNNRGILIAQMMEKLDLTVANKGKNPTFLNSRGHKSIIDITLTNKKGGDLISNWKTSTETSLSDHKIISFNINLGNTWESYSRNHKDMDAEAFSKAVNRKMITKPFRAMIGKFKKSNINTCMTYINKTLTEALDEVCPVVKVNHKSKTPWTHNLNILKKSA